MHKLVLASAFLFFIQLTVSLNSNLIAQDDDKSSRRQSEQISAIEKAGGRVYKISAADTTQEVSFALSSKPVGDKEIADLSAIQEVIWLNLAGTKITNAGLVAIKDLPLTKLHLERTQIGDDGLKHLAQLKDLVYLNLYDTQVTNAGLDHLKGLKNLKNLYVWKSKVTEEGMKKLNESLPDLKIVGELKLAPVIVEEPQEVKKDEKKKGASKDAPKPDNKKTEDKKATPAKNKKAGSKKRKKGKKKNADKDDK